TNRMVFTRAPSKHRLSPQGDEELAGKMSSFRSETKTAYCLFPKLCKKMPTREGKFNISCLRKSLTRFSLYCRYYSPAARYRAGTLLAFIPWLKVGTSVAMISLQAASCWSSRSRNDLNTSYCWRVGAESPA